jgi:hypothetical protein
MQPLGGRRSGQPGAGDTSGRPIALFQAGSIMNEGRHLTSIEAHAT